MADPEHPGTAANASVDALRAAIARIKGDAGPGEAPTAADHRRFPAPPPPDPQQEAAEADPEAVARAIALRQLTNSPKTRAQLARKLAERGCDPDVTGRVLDRLVEVGLVDDAAYAEMYVRAKQTTRGLSRRALAHELRRNGVADHDAEDVLDRIDNEEEVERARDLVRARLPRLHGLDRHVQVRRLAGLLARKGYPSGLASRIIFEEIDAAVEHRRD